MMGEWAMRDRVSTASPRHPILPLLLLSVLLLAGAARDAAAVTSGGIITIVPVPGALASPVEIGNAGDGSNRLFVIERAGNLRIFKGGQLLPTPFLNIQSLIPCAGGCPGERGLLGLAFHPSYATNGLFYVAYTRLNGDIILARYHVSANPDVADPSSAAVLLTIGHSAESNHNGGHLAFGPDGYLYMSVGDGGGAGDPFESKLLRLDVDHGSPYAIPAGNPFAGATPGLDEIWAYGLRNPWRFSFDRQTGDLYIGDVGQDAREEVDFQAAGAAGGQNYGWDCREGTLPYNDTSDTVNMPPVYNTDCPGRTFTEPVLDYSHAFGCAIIGGYVYRGRVPSFLTGQYLYGDYCSGTIWRTSASGSNGGPWTSTSMLSTGANISSFGQSESGRLYFADLATNTLNWLAVSTFSDVPPTDPAWSEIEAIQTAGITAGCDATRFCPDTILSRAEMAVFLVRGIHGAAFTPPPATGTLFADVPASFWAAPWIEQLYADGITTGCATSPLRFCPIDLVGRAEMSIFLLRARHGSSYVPPAATGTVFADVPASYWAASWIEQLYSEAVTNGCATNPLQYCPESTPSRAQMALFLARSFNLSLP
jgi:glucose/arabinose dehydrogenase